MKNYLLTIVFICIVLLNPVQAEEAEMTDRQKLGYAMGVFFAQSITQQNIDMDVDYFLAAVSDMLNDNPPRLSTAEIQAIFVEFQQREQQHKAQLAAVNSKAGQEFLEKNREQEGVVELDSGLQYKILRAGDGPSPKPDSEVTVHYQGTLINGAEFDSSYQRNEPARLSLNRVIQGWQQGLSLMKTGALWELYVPPELAYGRVGQGAIGPDETLVFKVELLEVH